jgi:hypothetical protein
MIEAGEKAAWDESNAMPAIRTMRKAYAAMLAASPVVPKTADEIKAVVMAWLDADDPASWGDFEKRLNAAVSDEASPVVPAPEGEAVDRVMAVLNYWFDGSRRIDRNSEMVAQLAALASPVVPVGVRERVAREICRIVRTWQGFVPTEEYTLEMEVENAWDDWLSEADAIIVALRPTDTGRE